MLGGAVSLIGGHGIDRGHLVGHFPGHVPDEHAIVDSGRPGGPDLYDSRGATAGGRAGQHLYRLSLHG